MKWAVLAFLAFITLIQVAHYDAHRAMEIDTHGHCRAIYPELR